MKFVEAKEPPKGARANQVVSMMKQLVEAKGDDPIPFEMLCEQADAKYPQDVQAAMIALELAGAVKRYTYVDTNSTRKRTAYALNPKVKVTA